MFVRHLKNKNMKNTLHTIELIQTETQKEGSLRAAREIAELIRSKQSRGEQAVLGMATGSTVLGVYQELIGMHREQGLSFSNVVSFNLDEYVPLQPEHPMSYHRYMHEKLFDHVDMPQAGIFIPSGNLPKDAIGESCRAYEAQIRSFGGIDLQLLGIGRNGHIGFNEPGSAGDSRTRLVELDEVTRRDAAGGFGGLDNVPKHAITTGIATILEAERILLMAWSEAKAPAIAGVINGPVTEDLPASFLKTHPAVQFVLDRQAASQL